MLSAIICDLPTFSARHPTTTMTGSGVRNFPAHGAVVCGGLPRDLHPTDTLLATFGVILKPFLLDADK